MKIISIMWLCVISYQLFAISAEIEELKRKTCLDVSIIEHVLRGKQND